MRQLFFLLLGQFILTIAMAQQPRQLPAKKISGTIKVDGVLDEVLWQDITPATQFIEWRPNAGKVEDSTNRTLIYLAYDNTSVYVGGFCHERVKDSVSRELIGRDKVGINDFVGVILDTYNDKINGVGFFVTPYGEQFDAKYSNSGDEDGSWNAVWDSEAKIHDNGWSFEMRIPYSALRFANRDNQTWGMNITRKRTKSGKQYMWNAIDPQKNGFINQEGEWTGIEKIQAPLRLSLSPYLSGYVNHYEPDTKNWRTSITGGMDVKYGISESFTLDMTLIPDFGQVPTDPQVLNLSPFEVKYEENRAFFTEGTELFNKGNLFYSRRIGQRPLNYWSIEGRRSTGENVLENPSKTKLVNATKISGRTKKGFGLGVFNAITKPMYAKIENADKEIEKIQTSPLTNYNILVFDQSLKNNSSVSFINTNTLRSGHEYDANVSAALFNINNKKNTYNWNGKFSVSKLFGEQLTNTLGYSHNLGFGKTGGRFNFNLSQEVTNAEYNISDMGYFTTTNYVDHYLWVGYKWTKPGPWFNQLRINYNLGHSQRFKGGEYQSLYTNINSNAQLKNLWWVGGFLGYNPEGNDFYEARNGSYFRTSSRWNMEAWFESNGAKKYSFGASFFGALHKFEKGRNYYFNFFHKYRFNDKFSLGHQVNYQPFKNNVGYDDHDGSNSVFSLRDRRTATHSLNGKYNFNNKSGITLSIRHYWSEVDKHHFYKLNNDGSLTSYSPLYDPAHQNYNQFSLFAEYTLQFAPGSFVNVVWKNENEYGNDIIDHQYFKNLDRTMEVPHVNNLSVRILYYLDYLDFKKWRNK